MTRPSHSPCLHITGQLGSVGKGPPIAGSLRRLSCLESGHVMANWQIHAHISNEGPYTFRRVSFGNPHSTGVESICHICNDQDENPNKPLSPEICLQTVARDSKAHLLETVGWNTTRNEKKTNSHYDELWLICGCPGRSVLKFSAKPNKHLRGQLSAVGNGQHKEDLVSLRTPLVN